MKASSFHEGKKVRVATLKDGRRYLLHSFFKARALLYGDATQVDCRWELSPAGRVTEHVGTTHQKMWWVDEKDLSGWEDDVVKTRALALSLVKQAATLLGLAVKITNKGAVLAKEDGGAPVEEAQAVTAPKPVGDPHKLSKEEARSLVSALFMRRE